MACPSDLAVVLRPDGGLEFHTTIMISGGRWHLERHPDGRGRLVLEFGGPMREYAERVLGQQAALVTETPDLMAAIADLTALLREKLPPAQSDPYEDEFQAANEIARRVREEKP